MRPPERLPSDPHERTRVLVERSRPASSRPRLTDPELERRLSEREAERAIDYAEREDLFDRIDRVREQISESIDESSDGVIDIDLDDENSVVHHINVLRRG